MRISFIGSGNVANHLSKEFHKKGHEIVSIFSTNDTTGKKLAAATKAKFINHPKDLDTSSDVLILAVPDDQIQKVAKMLAKIFQRTSTIICHTSGTTDLKQISKFYDNSGIFYPLQSFSVLKEVDFSEIPICINANNEHVFGILKTLGATISEHVQALGDADRKILHVSAVFANNYSNYMYTHGRILERQAILGNKRICKWCAYLWIESSSIRNTYWLEPLATWTNRL